MKRRPFRSDSPDDYELDGVDYINFVGHATVTSTDVKHPAKKKNPIGFFAPTKGPACSEKPVSKRRSSKPKSKTPS